MRHALVIGGSGFVGRRLVQGLGARGSATFNRNPAPGAVAFDAVGQRLRDLLPSLRADLTHVFVPFGAIDMEGCARDPLATARVNVQAVTDVLHDALDAGLIPVFVSTDYVFDGDRGGWREGDEAHPRMAYGAQKLAVERWLAERPGPWLVARLSKVVSSGPEPQNILAEWLASAKADRPIRCAGDQVFSPAAAEDLAQAMIDLADCGGRGLFHVAGPRAYSRLQLVQTLADQARRLGRGPAFDIRPCSLRDFAFLENRPLDTSLCVDKLRDHIAVRFRPMDALAAEILGADAPGTDVFSA